MCNVVLRAGDVAAEIMAGGFVAVAKRVGVPIVIVFLFRLSPGVVAAVAYSKISEQVGFFSHLITTFLPLLM